MLEEEELLRNRNANEARKSMKQGHGCHTPTPLFARYMGDLVEFLEKERNAILTKID
ncbi:hypothetical protein SESBI_03001 [Sesbania bispinosa]|nr:hypothetical protein SESBI_03001 [Sesbania bispinosa]